MVEEHDADIVRDIVQILKKTVPGRAEATDLPDLCDALVPRLPRQLANQLTDRLASALIVSVVLGDHWMETHGWHTQKAAVRLVGEPELDYDPDRQGTELPGFKKVLTMGMVRESTSDGGGRIAQKDPRELRALGLRTRLAGFAAGKEVHRTYWFRKDDGPGFDVARDILASIPKHFSRAAIDWALARAARYSGIVATARAGVASTEPPVEKPARPISSQILARASSAYAADVRHLLAVDGDGGSPWGVYIKRDIEDGLLELCTQADAQTILLTGDAGSGKTSLLWALRDRLNALEGTAAYLISSALLASDATSSTYIPALLAEAERSRTAETRTLYLVDTVDLLLHSEAARINTLALIDEAAGAGVTVLAACRPQEAELALTERLQHKRSLKHFSTGEMERAIEANRQTFCPTVPHAQAITGIADARARGLPVGEVCESPLLLRLMFELASPGFPNLNEVDVSGLYAEYWQRRVQRDSRGLEAEIDSAIDLSGCAMVIGLTMVAIGQAEPHRADVLAAAHGTRVATTLSPNLNLSDGIELLIRRSVLQSTADGRIRFFHQTLFEYAAAKGVTDGRTNHLALMVERIMSSPTDLFIGAVVEQALILTAENPLRSTEFTSIVRTLLNSGSVPLQRTALGALAHKPQALVQLESEVTNLDASAAARFIRAVPRVNQASYEYLDSLFPQLWDLGTSAVRATIVDALIRLAARVPRRIAALAMTISVDSLFVPTTSQTTDPSRVLELLAVTAREEPGYVRAALIRIAKWAGQATGREFFVRVLLTIASQWAVLGSADYLDEVIALTRSVQKSKDPSGRDVRDALGAVLLADAGPRENWRERAARTAYELVADESDVLAGAWLSAFTKGVMAGHVRPDDGQIAFESFLQRAGTAAPRRLAVQLLVPLLASPLRAQAVRATGSVLVGLPADPRRRLTAPQLRGLMGRIALEDPRTPGAALRAALTYARPGLLRERDGLVSIAAAAHLAGAAAATALVREVAQDPAVLEPGARTRFIQESRRFVQEDELVAEAVISACIEDGDLAQLTLLVEMPSAHYVLIQHRDEIWQLVDSRLTATALPKEQRVAAALMHALAEAGLAIPPLGRVERALADMSDPPARARVIAALPLLVRHGADASKARALVRDIARVRQGRMEAGIPARAPSDSELEFAGDAAVEILSRWSPTTPDIWASILELVFRQRLVGKPERDITGVKNARWHLTRLVEEGSPGLAAERFLELGARLLRDEFLSKKQVNQASNFLSGAIRTIVRSSTAEQLNTLLQRLDALPVVAAGFVLANASQLRPAESLPEITRISSDRLLDDVIRQRAADILLEHRRLSSEMFPEVLA